MSKWEVVSQPSWDRFGNADWTGNVRTIQELNRDNWSNALPIAGALSIGAIPAAVGGLRPMVPAPPSNWLDPKTGLVLNP